MVSLGLANSRLKDFYDIWMLASRVEFDGQELADALGATFGRRRTPIPLERPVALTNEYVEQDTTARMWRRYRARLAVSAVEAPTDLSAVVDVISAFILPPAIAAAASRTFTKTWTLPTGWG
jgi:hypothetical protein